MDFPGCERVWSEPCLRANGLPKQAVLAKGDNYARPMMMAYTLN